MTDVNDLLRRIVEADDSGDYNGNLFKEAHEYLDGLEQRKESLKNANSLREAMGDEAYDQAMNAALFDIRLTRLEGVVGEILQRLDAEPQLAIGDYLEILNTLKEAE